ncbi:DEHA2F25410p [Debaryomyces hansenii CBS767]|uniref:DEHA2F25410p n=1 Tax=Debaryomyces hansenii (strain ATCC 36239 / CBS 767 / BCRC 21394 / JCM 1990 / NBRC 0083 / IGC 2968) TaxID=284592 RepID=Q6BK26_DEBHA|nr:DEHA2F25410p [Debaryomyces hansenii CBS767]CAG89860.1 DEHA2F25410p [Debaryomyces hansenii CBS767]|eukprot:XP_461445.1 DEHA2F25410p [Debaryomyces hansenii CBS767]
MSLGKVAHYSFDLVLISIILAGIHRNTGLVFDTSNLSSVDVRRWFGNYLAFGERCYDSSVSLLKMSGYFRQKNLVVDYVSKEANKYLKEQTGRDLKDTTKDK